MMGEILENSRFWYPRIPLRCIQATCLILGADRALPFQKPGVIADLMNKQISREGQA